MPIDKTWTTIENRNSDEFSRGLESFVERSKAYVDGRGFIRCPCRKCVNCDLIKVSLMKAHIERFGFSCRYITWIYHGETIAPPIIDDVTPRNEMVGDIDDVMGENDTNHDNGDSDTGSSAYSKGHSHTSPHTHVQPELEAILSNPAFKAGVAEIVRSLMSQNDNEDSYTGSSAYSKGHSHTSPYTHVQPKLEAILSNPAFKARVAEIIQSLMSQNDNGSENERNERDKKNDDNNGDE